MPELLKLLFEGMRRNRSVTAENFEKSVKAYLESEPYPEDPLWLHLLSAVEKTFLDIRRDIATMAKWKGLGNTNSSKSNSSNHNNSKTLLKHVTSVISPIVSTTKSPRAPGPQINVAVDVVCSTQNLNAT
jgi:hypothetical protein